MKGRNYRVSGDLSRTDTIMTDTFWLGIYPALGEEQLDYVATELEYAFGIRSAPASEAAMEAGRVYG